MTNRNKKISGLTWVYVSGAIFSISIILSVLLIIFSNELNAFGITSSFYYIILIPLGLCSAAFLFGALNSLAEYTGNAVYGKLKLSGPVVIFCLVIIGGFYFAKPESTFLLTVRTQTIENKIIDKGFVTAYFGSQGIKHEIGENGEAFFSDIPSKFLGKEINFRIDVAGYQLTNIKPERIPEDKIIYLQLERRKDTTVVRGIVIDSKGNAISNILIDFESGLASSTTDASGRFSTTVPRPAGSSVLLMASKNGRIGYNEYVTLPENNSLIINFK